MQVQTLYSGASLRVVATRCSGVSHQAPELELHSDHTIAFVRSGSFGYAARGVMHELVAGSLLLGHVGDEYRCTHTHHHGGDACLSFHFTPELFDELTRGGRNMSSRGLPPLPALMVYGQLALAAASGDSTVSLDEAGLLLASQVASLLSEQPRERSATPMDRRRVIEAALWLDAHAEQKIDLDRVARGAGLSRFQFQRTFTRVLGLSPHQYLLRVRLRRAARLLAEADLPISQVALDVGFRDLSNFVRTFHRAAGMSPGAFRGRCRARRA